MTSIMYESQTISKDAQSESGDFSMLGTPTLSCK